jgi:hypothetical protein
MSRAALSQSFANPPAPMAATAGPRRPAPLLRRPPVCSPQHDLSTAKRRALAVYKPPPPKKKSACGQNSTAPVGPSWRHLAVAPIPPAGWGTRSTRSHLGKRPEHEIPGFCSRRGGGGPGGAPRSEPDLPGKGWWPRGLGFESVPGGVPTGSTGGGRGRPKERAYGRQKVASKTWHSAVITSRTNG